ncbi:MAG: SIS domain-containing protein [Rhodospirillaceae bacterium]
MSLSSYLNESIALIEKTAQLIDDDKMNAVIEVVVRALAAGKPLLVCGNGGSAADAMHITGELVGRFLVERRALKAICLSDNPAVLTAWSNDYSYETVFSRQVEAYGEPGAVLLGLSTSGNSANVVAAFEKARLMGVVTVAMTGEGGGRLAPVSDLLLAVPSRYTPMIQQLHICLYHYLCMAVERRMAAGDGG